MEGKRFSTPETMLLAAFEAASRHDVSVSGVRALLLIDNKSRVHGASYRVTLKRLAAHLGMTVAGAHRVLAALEKRDRPLLQVERGQSGTRSGGIVLTLEGQRVVTALWQAVDPEAAQRREPLKQSALRVPDAIQQVSWNEETLDLELSPVSAVESDAVAEWMAEFLSKIPVKRKSPNGVILKFATIHDAVYFKLRWV